MPQWSSKKPAHVITWGTLAVLGESMRAFPNSGDVPMKKFIYWVGSAQLRSARARALAVRLDQTFRKTLGSKFEDGVSRAKAIPRITDKLLEMDTTMLGLAALHDELYKFMGEGE